MNNKLLTQLQLLKMTNLKPNFSELARLYGVDRRTVKKYYDGYEGKPAHHNKPSKLDSYLPLIREKLAIRGTTIKSVYEFLISEIDPTIGTYANFNRYVKSNELKPMKTPKGHPRFETIAAHQAQVDWKEDMKIANKYGEIFNFQVFNYKFGYSRYCHFTYKTTKTQQDVFDCLINSFLATGGVPQELLFDNMATVVDLKDGHRFINRSMKAFADDFHFKIRLAKPRHPYTKGKVEVSNKFLTWLLPYEGEFETEDELQAILKKINDKVNRQVCQETNCPPILLFQKEKEHLQSLPSNSIIESYRSYDRQITVQKDSLIRYKNCKYSVPPAYIGKRVWIKVFPDKLHIYYNTELIAVHHLSTKRLNYLQEHYTQLLSPSIPDEECLLATAKANLQQMDELL